MPLQDWARFLDDAAARGVLRKAEEVVGWGKAPAQQAGAAEAPAAIPPVTAAPEKPEVEPLWQVRWKGRIGR